MRLFPMGPQRIPLKTRGGSSVARILSNGPKPPRNPRPQVISGGSPKGTLFCQPEEPRRCEREVLLCYSRTQGTNDFFVAGVILPGPFSRETSWVQAIPEKFDARSQRAPFS